MNAGIKQFPGRHVFQSPLQALVGGEVTFPLPIQREPDLMLARLVCVITDAGMAVGSFLPWQVGDVIEGDSVFHDDGAGTQSPAFGVGYSRCGDGVVGGGLALRINLLGQLYTFKRYGGSGFNWPLTHADWNVKAVAIWFDP